MKTAIEVLFDPTLYGHALVEPVLWQERLVSQIFTTPLPDNCCSGSVEVVARTITFLFLVVALSFATAPLALTGWVIKYYSQPSDPRGPNGPGGGPPPPPAPPSSPDLAPTPQPEITAETVKTIKRRTLELRDLYNGLRVLDGSDAQNLFKAIAEFLSTYEQYRRVAGLTKSFRTIDAIAANASGMQRALEYYRNTADDNGVIRQPGDGNCWLHSSLAGLDHIDHRRFGNKTHQELRLEVVRWMRDHYEQDETLRQYVEGYDLKDDDGSSIGFVPGAIQVHQEIGMEASRKAISSFENSIYTEEERAAAFTIQEREQEILAAFTPSLYFAYMESSGSHGGPAEFYAISRLFAVNVVIWSKNSRGQLVNDQHGQIRYSSSDLTINVVYVNGNHFDYRLPGEN